VGIAYIIPTFPQLSETFIFKEVKTLRDMGLDVHVYASQRPSPEERQKLTSTSRALMDETQYLTPATVGPQLLRHPREASALWGEARRLQQAATNKASLLMLVGRAVALANSLREHDVDHLHAHWPYATQIAHLVHALTGISYSVSIHAHEVAHEDGHFPIIFDTLSFAAFCNRAAMEFLLDRLPPKMEEKAHLIYHGVDTDQFTFLPMPAQDDGLHVLSAGRLTPTKGFDRLIRGCARARESSLDVKLTILGKGELGEDLRTLASDLGVREHLHMPGWVPHDQVGQYLKQAHLFSLLADTNYHDGLPNVVLEAMASGRPVLLSPLPAVEEAVTNRREGYILEGPKDLQGFVSILKKAVEDHKRIKRIGKKARERVLKDHSSKLYVKKMKKMFELQK